MFSRKNYLYSKKIKKELIKNKIYLVTLAFADLFMRLRFLPAELYLCAGPGRL